jgi:hypothetical protein
MLNFILLVVAKDWTKKSIRSSIRTHGYLKTVVPYVTTPSLAKSKILVLAKYIISATQTRHNIPFLYSLKNK